MAIVGAFARVEIDQYPRAESDLNAIEGVSTFDLEEPGKVGLLVETGDLDEAHGIIKHTIPAVPGVLGVWPVYANIEDEADEAYEAGGTVVTPRDDH